MRKAVLLQRGKSHKMRLCLRRGAARGNVATMCFPYRIVGISMVLRSLLIALLLVALPIAAVADPCSDLIKMYKNMVASTSYRLVETSPEGPTITTEFAAPDRVHISGGGTETITIGNKQYSRLLGKWFETDVDAGSSATSMLIREAKAYSTGDMLLNLCTNSNPIDAGMKDGLRVIQLNITKYGVDRVYFLRPDLLPSRFEITTRGKTYVKTWTDWNMPIEIGPPH